MSTSVFEYLPGETQKLIEGLDRDVPPAIVRNAKDMDPFELGVKAGRRDLVDQLVAVLKRQQEDDPHGR